MTREVWRWGGSDEGDQPVCSVVELENNCKIKGKKDGAVGRMHFFPRNYFLQPTTFYTLYAFTNAYRRSTVKLVLKANAINQNSGGLHCYEVAWLWVITWYFLESQKWSHQILDRSHLDFLCIFFCSNFMRKVTSVDFSHFTTSTLKLQTIQVEWLLLIFPCFICGFYCILRIA